MNFLFYEFVIFILFCLKWRFLLFNGLFGNVGDFRIPYSI